MGESYPFKYNWPGIGGSTIWVATGARGAPSVAGWSHSPVPRRVAPPWQLQSCRPQRLIEPLLLPVLA